MRSGDARVGLLWRIVIVFLAASFVWVMIVGGLNAFFGPAYSDRVGHAVRAILIFVLAVPLVVLARRYLDRRSLEELRVTSLRAGWRPLLFGMAFWLIAAGTGLAVTLALGWVRVFVGTPSAGVVLLALYLPLLVFLYEAFPEELVFRGYFYRNLTDRYTRWFAVVAQAALFTLFGAVIGAAGSVDRIILFFTFSIVLGLLRVITGSLWGSIGFHLAFQWVTQLNAAAIREGVVRIEGRSELELVAFWLFPIVLGSVALVAASVLRGRAGWREHHPDTPAVAPTEGVSR